MFHAEHVGSFPRPEALVRARAEHAAGRMPLAALRAAEDDAIRDVVALQERVGIGAITDGELRRASWRDAAFEHCSGFTQQRYDNDFTFRLFDGSVRRGGPVPNVVGKVCRQSPMAAEHFALLKPLTKGLPKVTLPSPSVTHFFRGKAGIDPAVYPDVAMLLADVAVAYREEVADLAARGCRYLQMDEVPLAVICDPSNWEIVRKRGEDPDRVIDLYVDAINDAIRDRPSDMRVALHMCRGNQGHGMADGGYEAIAERVFGRLDVDGYLLEFDTPRAGDFQPLRHVPAGKRVAIGIVSTKTLEVESADALKRRIDAASACIDLGQLCVCPQCGFSSTVGLGTMPLAVIERKLATLVEVADQVWGRG